MMLSKNCSLHRLARAEQDLIIKFWQQESATNHTIIRLVSSLSLVLLDLQLAFGWRDLSLLISLLDLSSIIIMRPYFPVVRLFSQLIHPFNFCFLSICSWCHRSGYLFYFLYPRTPIPFIISMSPQWLHTLKYEMSRNCSLVLGIRLPDIIQDLYAIRIFFVLP